MAAFIYNRKTIFHSSLCRNESWCTAAVLTWFRYHHLTIIHFCMFPVYPSYKTKASIIEWNSSQAAPDVIRLVIVYHGFTSVLFGGTGKWIFLHTEIVLYLWHYHESSHYLLLAAWCRLVVNLNKSSLLCLCFTVFMCDMCSHFIQGYYIFDIPRDFIEFKNNQIV